MLHILLVILKIIGIVFVAVFSLLLFLFLVFFFGPVRYRVKGQAGKTLDVEGNISWLFFVLRCKIEYTTEKGFLWYVRIFGFLFASNEEHFVVKNEAKKETRREKKQKQAGVLLEKTEKITEHESRSFNQTDAPHPIEEKKSENVSAQKMEEKEIPKSSFFDKLRGVIKKSKNFLIRIKKKITSIPGKLASIRDRVIEKKNWLFRWKEYFIGEANKEVMIYILSRLKKLVLHILPNRFCGRLEFGLNDPYIMGQILAILGILMPIYQDKLNIIPDFEEEKLRGEVFLKGTIIPGYLIFCLCILIVNKEVRRIIKEGKQLIGGNV